jgi:DHA1 family multidrug resistance protein-like MFS transporter
VLHDLEAGLEEPTGSTTAAAPTDPTGLRATISIGIAAGIGSMSFNFWYPFMPLYLRHVGAKSDADALLWVAVATTVQGITRLLTGPFWGVLSDRLGRKLMLLRALYLATPTTVIAALVASPWQMSIALGFQGLFSGFVPAAVALTSVSVPESRLNSSLSLVTGSQYIGTTVGPALGALFAAFFGFRGAILVAAFLPSLAATLVLVLVPSDRAGRHKGLLAAPAPLEPFKPTFQLGLVIFFYFIIFSMTQLIRLATPIAIKEIHPEHVSSITGAAFTLAGLASAISVLVIAPRFFRPGSQRFALVGACLLCALFYLLLSRSGTVPVYVAFFVLVSLMQAAMIPPTNTLIAANVPRSRRGTAFGWAGSAQAVAFVAGPMGAALFGAVSLDLGFVVLAAILLMMALLLLKLREPDLEP